MGAQRNALQPLGPVSRPKARTEGGGAGGHVKRAGSGKHAVGVCDDGARARGGGDTSAGGAGGGADGHVQCAERGKHAVGVYEAGAGGSLGWV
jgi:hypothetical protein